MMKNYKKYNQISIGNSNEASLTLETTKLGEVSFQRLNFGEDGDYYAYLVDENAEIGEHYQCVYDTSEIYPLNCVTLTIFDDCIRTIAISGRRIRIFRAGLFGCIIQVFEQKKLVDGITGQIYNL